MAGDFTAGDADALWFAGVVLGMFLTTNALNFLMAAPAATYAYGAPVRVVLGRS